MSDLISQMQNSNDTRVLYLSSLPEVTMDWMVVKNFIYLAFLTEHIVTLLLAFLSAVICRWWTFVALYYLCSLITPSLISSIFYPDPEMVAVKQ